MKEVTIDNVRERIKAIASRGNTEYGIGLTLKEEFELACLRQLLAAMDSEPVSQKEPISFDEWSRKCALQITLCYPDFREKAKYIWDSARETQQPAPERDRVRREHAEWSQATFGNVGPIGPLKHLSKEALEAAAAPGDLSEWADMQFLLWDAQRRAGITDEQITQAMIDKLAVNKARTWPEPKDGEPRLHVKEQQGPVVRDEHLLQNLETRINSLEIGERKGALSTQQATSLKAYRLAVQCLRSSATSDENATDNTAQQFEALATSAESSKQ